MFHHQSAPDVTALPTGAYLVRRNLASIEGYLVFDSTDTQVYRFKGHLSFPSQRWSMHDAAGTEVATLVRPPLHLHPTFTVLRPRSTGCGDPQGQLLADPGDLAHRGSRGW